MNILVTTLLLTMVLSPTPSQGECVPPFYGFDSRLDLEVIGQLSLPVADVVDFHIINGRAVVARKDSVEIISTSGNSVLDLESEVTGLLSTPGELRVVTVDGIQIASSSGLKEDELLPFDPQQLLIGSGSETYLQVVHSDGGGRLVAINKRGESLSLFAVPTWPQAISWNQFGLAAIVEGSLIIWEQGTKHAKKIMADPILEQAQNVLLVGPGRAVVSLLWTTLVVTKDATLELAGVGGRLAWSEGRLFLLERITGLVLAISGLELVGISQQDEQHAYRLLDEAEPPYSEDPHFAEAVRIIGCNDATNYLEDKAQKVDAAEKRG